MANWANTFVPNLLANAADNFMFRPLVRGELSARSERASAHITPEGRHLVMHVMALNRFGLVWDIILGVRMQSNEAFPLVGIILSKLPPRFKIMMGFGKLSNLPLALL